MANKFGGWFWESFTSIRLTIFLLLTLALVALVGAILPQGTPLAAYQAQFGSTAGSLLWWGGFGYIFMSPWFLGPVGLLALNLVCCLAKGLPQAIRRSLQPFSSEAALNLPERGRFIWPGGGDGPSRVEAVFRRELGRPRKEAIADKTLFFWEQGRLRPVGPYIVHLALLAILVGGLLGKFWGIEGFLRLNEGQTAENFSLGQPAQAVPLGFKVHLDRFKVSYYKGSEMPQEFRSDLTFTAPGREGVKAVCRVNDPVSFGGLTFYQYGYGPHARLELCVADFCRIVDAPFDRWAPLPDGTARIRLMRTVPDLKGLGPAALLAYQSGQDHPKGIWIIQNHPELAEKAGSPFHQPGPHLFHLFSISSFSELQVKRDPGVWWVYAGFLLICVGLYLAFFHPPQRWAVALQKGKKGGWEGLLLGASPRARESFLDRQDRLLEQLKGGGPS